ncbi:tyrosine-type recombinase/integrase [Luteolibacter soli]|uniref:Tyrosine-type recombinase/integrase n=1 Tax=Luteolibacter soli TaxID=3135280 RepID=A0ABU9AQ47_9BACT
MPYLVRRTGSPFWFAGFDVTMPDGSVRRLKKSTKRRKRSEAMEEAVRMEATERKAALGGSDIAGKAFSALSEAADAAARGELSEARAREIIAKMAEASTGEALRFYTVRSWAADWLSSKTTGTKEATGRRYKTSIDAFLSFIATKADGRLEGLTKADVRGFRDSLRTGRSAATVNFYMADVSGMLRAAVREGLLLASPAAALGKLPEDDSLERETFTIAEVGRLVEAAGGQEWQDKVYSRSRDMEKAAARSRDWQGLILAGFYTGARLGDCAGLTWSNVDLASGVLSFMPAKTSRKKKKLQIPLHPRLKTYLLEIKPEIAKGPVFPCLHSRSVAGKTGLSGHFGAIAEAAGVDRRTVREATKDKKGKVVQRSVQARTFHSLRHSLTSQLANADVPEEIRMRITGHKSKETHQGYTAIERQTLARAVEKLPTI